MISDVETTTKLAELGVVFFLEMGLELELERLKSVGRDAFTLGTSQFLMTGALLADRQGRRLPPPPPSSSAAALRSPRAPS